MHETIAYEILLQAVTPIAHHRESLGNHALLERRKVRLVDGSWAQVPAVSGDTMRHGMREAAAYAFLDAAGMLGAESLTESALRLLFSGGMVTGRGDASHVKLDDYHALCDVFPPLAILGGCVSSRVVPGRLVSEDALLICEESAHLVPAWMVERAGTLDSCRAHITTHQRVRMDPLLDPAKADLLTAPQAAKLTGKRRKSEIAHEEDDAVAREQSKSTMLPRTFEAVAAGSLLAWRVIAVCRSALEVDTFQSMVGGFLAGARVGGRKGTGFGAIRPVAANAVSVSRPADSMRAVDATALGPRVGETFRAHVRDRADKAKEWLGKVDA